MTDEILAQYPIVEQIAANEQSETYRAIDKDTGSPVRLHVFLSYKYNDGPKVRELLERLDRISRHENLCEVRGFGLSKETIFLVSEDVSGAFRLADLLNSAAFKTDDVIRTARQVAVALEHLHNNNVIHADVKASNVLLYDDGPGSVRVKLDAIWTHALNPSAHTQETSPPVGSRGAATLSPTKMADIWALGSLCVQMFWAPHHGNLPDLRSDPDVIPDKQLRRICERMLSPEPLDRPDASCVREYLQSIQKPQPERRGSSRWKLLESEFAAICESVLQLDAASLNEEYNGFADPQSAFQHVRETASRAFMQIDAKGCERHGMLMSAMGARPRSNDEPAQLSFFDATEDYPGEDHPPIVLLVDELDAERSGRIKLLKSSGFAVKAVRTSEQAVALLEEESIDAVAVWFPADEQNYEGTLHLLRQNTHVPVLSVLRTSDDADLLAVLGRITRHEVQRRRRRKGPRPAAANPGLFCIEQGRMLG